jgi:hypothetical protein
MSQRVSYQIPQREREREVSRGRVAERGRVGQGLKRVGKSSLIFWWLTHTHRRRKVERTSVVLGVEKALLLLPDKRLFLSLSLAWRMLAVTVSLS